MTVDSTEVYEAVPDTEINNSEVQNAQGEESVSQDIKESDWKLSQLIIQLLRLALQYRL